MRHWVHDSVDHIKSKYARSIMEREKPLDAQNPILVELAEQGSPRRESRVIHCPLDMDTEGDDV